MFNKIKVKSTLKNVIAIDDGEFFLGAEPYLWPIYFKVDGSENKCSVDLKVEINLLKPPLFINDVDDILKINGESSVKSFDDNIFTSYGNLRNVTTGIEGWLFGDTGVIIPQDGLSDNTEILNPMPLNISLEMKGFDKYKPFNMNLSEIFKGISDNTTRCEKIFKHLDKVDASFVFSDVIPGIMGSIYILREQDTQLDNTHIEKARKVLVTEVKKEIDKLISSISLDDFDFSESSMIALQKRVAKNVEDKTLASFDSWDWTRLALRSILEAMAISMITGGALLLLPSL